MLTNPSQATVGAVVTGIDSAGRRPVLLAEQQAELADYGGTASEVVNLLTTQEAHNLTAPPTRTWLIHYTVWMSQPASTGSADPEARLTCVVPVTLELSGPGALITGATVPVVVVAVFE